MLSILHCTCLSCVCSNVTTWQVHNSLLLTKLVLKHILEHLSEVEAILQLDGAQTVRQITSLEKALPTSPTSSSASTSAQVTAEDRSSGRAGSAASLSGRSPLSSHRHPQVRVSSPDLNSLASQAAGFAGKSAAVVSLKESETSPGSEGGRKVMEQVSINPEEILSMERLLSKQLVEHIVSLLAEVLLL